MKALRDALSGAGIRAVIVIALGVVAFAVDQKTMLAACRHVLGASEQNGPVF